MFHKFEIFIQAYELKNFSEVAEALYISQPTVSVKLKALEEDLNLKLFVRQGPKQVLPTPEAHYLYSQLLHMRDSWAQTLDHLENIEAKKEVCKIACSHTTSIVFVPQIMKELQKKFKTLVFEIHKMNSDEVMDMVEKHHAHIGFIEKPLTLKEVNRFPVFEDELVWAGNPSASQWLMREANSGIRHYNELFIKERDIHFPVLKTNSNAVIVELLREGVGQSVLSKHSILPGITVQEENVYKRYFYCVTRNQPPTSEISLLNDYLEKKFKIQT